MIEFHYDNEQIKTIDNLTISLADLRDLIQAVNLNPEDRFLELDIIVRCILRKNHLGNDTFKIINGENPMTEDEIYDGLVSRRSDKKVLEKWISDEFGPHDYITMLKMVGRRIEFEDVELPKG